MRLRFEALALLAMVVAVPAWGGSARDGREVFGPYFEAETLATPSLRITRHGDTATSWVHHWNQVAIDASGRDHTPPAAGEGRVFAEQLGPGRASLAMAIVHIAIFDAIVAIEGGYESYSGLAPAGRDTSLKAAIAQAAHDTLAELYPAQAEDFSAQLAADLGRISDSAKKRRGVELGKRSAAAIFALRANDGSDHEEPLVGIDYPTSDLPGHWRQDSVSLIPLALGAGWSGVAPLVIAAADEFRVPPPPPLDSAEYAQAFGEVQRLGGDGIATPTERSDERTFIGIFWAYDGTPSLCAPPRLYNQIAVTIALQQRADVVALARLLALVNVAMADAALAIWESKYFHDFWRPVTGIREADPGGGPSGFGDGNPATVGDPAFTPLGAPASNASAPNFTPPFPAYPSGHAGFGGALFQTLRRFYGRDGIAFTFVSDEWNGVTRDNEGNLRPLIPRHFESLSEAEEENGQSRIYLGIHWAFDKTAGIAQGRRVADEVFERAFQPLKTLKFAK